MSNSGYNRPQKRRNIRRGIMIALVFVCAMMLLFDRQQKAMLASGRLSADDASAKFMGFVATPVRGIEAMFSRSQERTNAYTDNITLRAEVERLRAFENKALDLEIRVRKFEQILSVDSSTDTPIIKIIARAVSEMEGPFVHSALINAGKNKGVKAGHPVMNADGFYGHIVRTGKTSARVLLLNDLNSRIAVMSQRTESRAILIGANTRTPRLDYIAPEADWKIGDRVVTSGDAGVLPYGLPIGTVVSLTGQVIGVKPFTQDKPIDWVWVLPYTPTPKPEDTEILPAANNESIPAGETP